MQIYAKRCEGRGNARVRTLGQSRDRRLHAVSTPGVCRKQRSTNSNRSLLRRFMLSVNFQALNELDTQRNEAYTILSGTTGLGCESYRDWR